ncbi:MAG: DUF3786 domain-containing protein [Thermodesulfobacteriota bacterium]
MAIGVCGIQCDVCGLHVRGLCSTCGPGTSIEAAKKLDAQERILGAPCPILACAAARRLDHCSRDCADYPCRLFRTGPYPFSEAYLDMQKRRRAERPPDRTPSGGAVEVPSEYWDALLERDPAVVCRNAGARPKSPAGFLLPFLKEFVLVDTTERRILGQDPSGWKPLSDPLLELLCLVYLLNASPAAVQGRVVGVRELRGARFFSGPHDLDVQPLLSRFGRDPAGFRQASERMQGDPVDLAEVAYRFQVFPKIPLYYLLWEGDDEFPPRLTVLFDRSIDEHLAPDGVWGLFNLVTGRLLYGSRSG